MANDISISYDRFSDPKQRFGDSEDRQNRAYASFVQRYKLQPASEYSFIDRGMSGYSGKHRDKGELGRLLEIAKTGVFKPKRGQPGYVLVIEAWDRLGRLRPDRMIDLIREVLGWGLKIGICRLDDIFEEKDFGSHKWIVLSTFVHLAHQESKQKSERMGHSWKSRKERARESGQPVTTHVPAWLKVVNGKMVAIPERIAVIKRIFHLAGSGYGIIRILRVLKNDGIPPFGNTKRSKRWNTNYVLKILTSRQVLGEYQPEKLEEQPDGTMKRVKDGPPIKNYYPRIISDEEYALARAGAGERKGRSGPRQRTYINLFQGLLRNAHLPDDTMFLHNNGTRANPRLILVNDAGRNSGHAEVRFSYPVFERAVLSLLREVPASVVAPTEPSSAVDILQTRYDLLRKDIEELKADLRKGYSASITEVLREKELEIGPVKQQLDVAQAEMLHPLADAWSEVDDLVQALKHGGEEAKLRLKAALRRCISSITLLIERRGIESAVFVDVRFKSGISRVYVIWHRPPHRCGNQVRNGYWWACSAPFQAPKVDLSSGESQAFAREFVQKWEQPDTTKPMKSKHLIVQLIE